MRYFKRSRIFELLFSFPRYYRSRIENESRIVKLRSLSYDIIVKVRSAVASARVNRYTPGFENLQCIAFRRPCFFCFFFHNEVRMRLHHRFRCTARFILPAITAPALSALIRTINTKLICIPTKYRT